MKSGFARSAAVLAALALVFSACATAQDNPKTTIGAMGGAAGGGLIAAAAGGGAAAIVGGVLLGGLLGGAVGNALDQRLARGAVHQDHAAADAPIGAGHHLHRVSCSN